MGQKNKDVCVEENNNNGAPAPATTRPVPAERLAAVGVAPDLAEALAQRHPPELIAAAVRAADRDGVRSPSGFVVSALRDGWDLSEAVAEERAARQRERRETQQADAEAAARSAQERQRVRTDGWSAAISAALDDRALACAIAAVTRPVPGVGRRSAPVVHAELITWAAAVACRDSDRSLREALLDDLARGPIRPGSGVGANLPDPPARPDDPGSDLTSRIAACLRTPTSPAHPTGEEQPD